MNVLKELLHFRLGHLYIELPLKSSFVNCQYFNGFLNEFGNVFYLVSLLFNCIYLCSTVISIITTIISAGATNNNTAAGATDT